MRPPKSPILVVAVLAWALLAGTGFAWLGGYEHQPGRGMGTPEYWPVESRGTLASNRVTLLMFAHPRCPCTRASLAELARLMARCGSETRATVLFLQPESSDPDWEATDLWRLASSIPGVAVAADVGGTEARRFHSETSGHVVLYDLQGRLCFAGGITPSRGHEGANAGIEALEALLKDGQLGQFRAPVFG